MRQPVAKPRPLYVRQIERIDSAKGSWLACGRCKANESDFRAKGLLPGRQYSFRVSAVNRMGESDPAEANEVITIPEKETQQQEEADRLIRAT